MGTGTQEENGGDNYSELLAELFAGVFPVSKEAQAAVATLFDEARRIWRDAHPKVSIPALSGAVINYTSKCLPVL